MVAAALMMADQKRRHAYKAQAATNQKRKATVLYHSQKGKKMKKLSHKEICRMGEMMDGIKLECNIYTFENAEHYISRLEQFNEKSGVCCHKVNEIKEKKKKAFPNAKGCQVDSKYYAAGIYGCIGRLSKVTILDKEWNSTGNSFYIYF